MEKLPQDIINKIMLYNRHPLADLFKTEFRYELSEHFDYGWDGNCSDDDQLFACRHLQLLKELAYQCDCCAEDWHNCQCLCSNCGDEYKCCQASCYDKPDELELDEYCDCCAECWDDCQCWCSNCGDEYKCCKANCYD